jgi:hypothetical protein
VATAHGKDSYFAVEDSAASTLRNISPHVKNVEFNVGNDTHDTTTKGDEGHEFLPGLTNGTISVTGLWDDTASTGSQTVLSGLIGIETTVGFEYGPEGSTTGMVKYSGECVLSTYQESSPVDDMVAFSAEFNISGSVTIGTFA